MRRIHPVATVGPLRLGQQPASLVVAQCLRVHPGGLGDLPAAQRPCTHDAVRVASARTASASTTAAY
ncbi:hypothetical protein [Streptomyces sp. NBC_00286]|uniref:hypothetical protein n=1 Tax=Streptomyces sp. NBC_00286 TaxID=2975701 RepID=UPI002E2D9BC3|nr:hypothetical protein [Streptomyces sp. NBC_00286]